MILVSYCKTVKGVDEAREEMIGRDDGTAGGGNRIQDMMIEAGIKPAPFIPVSDDVLQLEAIERAEARNATELERKTLDELEDMDGKVEENTLAQLRRKRIQEIQQRAKEGTLRSRVRDIHEVDFERLVLQASEEAPVAMLIYREGNKACALLSHCLDQLSKKYSPSSSSSSASASVAGASSSSSCIEFVKLRATGENIKNFPLEHCPTLMLYKARKVVGQLSTLRVFAEHYTNPDVVEWELHKYDMLDTTLTEDPQLCGDFRILNKDNIHRYGSREGSSSSSPSPSSSSSSSSSSSPSPSSSSPARADVEAMRRRLLAADDIDAELDDLSDDSD